jgi:hypothetical protein
MSRPPLFFAPLLLGLAALGGSPASVGDESENLRQLQAMPRERRVALAENLERFDKLDSAEQAAIRKLDAEIARKDPVERARYRSLLRRYHLWVNGLTEEQKAQLKAAEGTESRFNLARKFRLKELEDASSGTKVFGIRTGDYGVIGPYEAAHMLRIWTLLTPAKKIEIERQQPRSRLFKEINLQQKSVRVPFQPFPNAEEKLYDARLESDETFKKQLGPFSKRVDAFPKKAEALPKGEVPPKRFELRFSEFLYFEDHKPRPVSQANLERFSVSCPGWFHEMLDPLSSDDARAYLTIVYRLLYPEPAEMPADAKTTKGSASSTPSTPKPGGNKSSPDLPM